MEELLYVLCSFCLLLGIFGRDWRLIVIGLIIAYIAINFVRKQD